jgi:very-short-patch-repair endonuclease
MSPEIQRARDLRRNMSEPEILLWSRLRRLRDRGFHIRRQAPFHGYYLDFVCHTRRLVIEVDGSQHGGDVQSDHDVVRDRILNRKGYRVLRFWTGEIRRDLGSVVDRIVQALETAPSVRESLPSLSEEGGRGEAEVGWGSVVRSADSELDRDSPTLTASRSVPPH